MDNLLKDVKSDIYGSANNSNRQLAERVRRNILQYFSYSDVKEDII